MQKARPTLSEWTAVWCWLYNKSCISNRLPTSLQRLQKYSYEFWNNLISHVTTALLFVSLSRCSNRLGRFLFSRLALSQPARFRCLSSTPLRMTVHKSADRFVGACEILCCGSLTRPVRRLHCNGNQAATCRNNHDRDENLTVPYMTGLHVYVRINSWLVRSARRPLTLHF